MTALRARLINEPDPPKPEFSLGRYVRARLTGEDAPHEDRILERIAKDATWRGPTGELIPFEALAGKRDLSVGLGGDPSGGYLVGTADRKDLFLDALRPFSITGPLGIENIGNLSANLTVPSFTTGATATWAEEGEYPGETQPTIGQITFTPKRATADIDYTRNLLLQAGPDFLTTVLSTDLRQAFAAAVDAAIIDGPGGVSPLGILSTTGVGSVSGASLNIAGATDAVGTVSAANVPLLNGAFLMPSAVWEILSARVATSSGHFLIEDGRMCGFPVIVSEAMTAATVLFGNFSMGVALATWGRGVELIINPYTGSKTGMIQLTANLHADVFVKRPAAFCKIVEVT